MNIFINPLLSIKIYALSLSFIPYSPLLVRSVLKNHLPFPKGSLKDSSMDNSKRRPYLGGDC
jgi:hypothetical protein